MVTGETVVSTPQNGRVFVVVARVGGACRADAPRGPGELDHPAVEPLLRYKELARLYWTHGWAWLDEWVRGGRFVPEFVVGGVVSGRWAAAREVTRLVFGATPVRFPLPARVLHCYADAK